MFPSPCPPQVLASPLALMSLEQDGRGTSSQVPSHMAALTPTPTPLHLKLATSRVAVCLRPRSGRAAIPQCSKGTESMTE